MDPVLNALSIDLEEYYQTAAVEGAVPFEEWERQETRVEASTDRCLELLEKHDVRATFFILGWVAQRHRGLVSRISEAGHEIASHGFRHQLIYRLEPEVFARDIDRAKKLLEDMIGRPVVGYRAPSYSITRESLWALEVIRRAGYRYDSSVFPIRHDRYGIPGAARFPDIVSTPGGNLVEFPLSTWRVLGYNWPIAGGGYLRIFPLQIMIRGIRALNRASYPAITYFHPWELDPDQPRFRVGFVSRFRQYRNLDRTEKRIERLLENFRYAPVREVLESRGFSLVS